MTRVRLLLGIARVLAWTVAVGAVGAVVLGYEALPAELPVTRWSVAPKSPLIALRVPLINLLTIGLIEVLSLGVSRAIGVERATLVVAVLLLTAAAKSAIEAAGILALPKPFSWTLVPLAGVLVVGLGTAAYLGRELFQPRRWSELKMTRREVTVAVALVIAIVALNAPLVVR